MPHLQKLFGRLPKDYRIWQWLLALYWLALAVATHLPKRYPGLPSGHSDKVMHCSAFALLALLLAITWQLAAGRLMSTHLAVTWLVLVVYAALDEWTQMAVGRNASLADWLADVIGALVGIAAFVIVRRRFTQ